MVYYGNRHSNKGNVDDLISNLFTSFVIMSFFIFYTSNWFTYLLVYFVILSFYTVNLFTSSLFCP